jgi:hypothetical protein
MGQVAYFLRATLGSAHLQVATLAWLYETMKLVVELDPHDFPAALALFHNIRGLIPQTTFKGPFLPSIINKIAERGIEDVVKELVALMAAHELGCEPAKVVEAIVSAHMQGLVNGRQQDTNEIYALLISR